MVRSLIASLAFAAAVLAQPTGTNFEKSKVPAYTLPDLLVMKSGGRVSDAGAWRTVRCAEVFSTLETQMFGRAPGPPRQMTFDVASVDKGALGGKAVRKEITINLSGHTLNLLLYLPSGARGKVPVFLGLNFWGNHTVHTDPGVRLAQVWRRRLRQNRAGARRSNGSSRKSSRADTGWPRSTTATSSRTSTA